MNLENSFSEFLAGQHVVHPIPFKAPKLIGLSAELLEYHYENIYGGTVRKLNAIEQQLKQLDWKTAGEFNINGIKREEMIAANSMVLHEVYFDSLGEEGGEAIAGHDDLINALIAGFGSIAQWQTEFTAMAKALAGGSGWVVLAWSERQRRLINQWSTEHCGNLTGTVPIMALDMYEHAYQMDFSVRVDNYVDVVMQNLHWGRIAKRLQRALDSPDEVVDPESTETQISIGELKSVIDQAGEKPVILDVRHLDDKARSGRRLLATPWRDSFSVPEWAGEFSKQTPIVVYCAYGFWVSEDAAAELRAMGYDARFLAGGLAAWAAMGYDMTSVERCAGG